LSEINTSAYIYLIVYTLKLTMDKQNFDSLSLIDWNSTRA